MRLFIARSAVGFPRWCGRKESTCQCRRSGRAKSIKTRVRGPCSVPPGSALLGQDSSPLTDSKACHPQPPEHTRWTELPLLWPPVCVCVCVCVYVFVWCMCVCVCVCVCVCFSDS